jgi:hypothetical protein
MFKKLCIIVANSSASLIAKSSALLVADYNVDMVSTEDLGTVWRIIICTETPRDGCQRLE